MDHAEAKNLTVALSNALNAMTEARSATVALRTAVRDTSQPAANIAALIGSCQKAHAKTLEARDVFEQLLGAAEVAILKMASPRIRDKIDEASKQAKVLAAPPTITTTEALLAADEDAEQGLRALSYSLKALTQRSVWQTFLSENYLAGSVVMGFCLIFFFWFHTTIQGKLVELAQVQTARGILTLMVVGTTIFVGIIIVLGMWLGDGDDESEKKFLRSKEVFSILMTTSGTILGFYYGSDKGSGPPEPQLEMTVPAVLRTPGQTNMATVTASISGGKSPYYFSIQSTNMPELQVSSAPAQGGTILYTWTNLTNTTDMPFKIIVTDATTNRLTKDGHIPQIK